jgi:hypothetical protein
MPLNRPIAVIIALLTLQAAGSAAAAGTNPDHRLMVYSIQNYEVYYDDCDGDPKAWKGAIWLQPWQDPYQFFWNYLQLNCWGDECASSDSIRRQGPQVTPATMAGPDGWHDADMVFFFGHNTMIQPRQSHAFPIWHHESYGYYDDWCADTVDWLDWGTPAEPYTYHRHEVDDASETNAYAVYYGYDPFTSILIGQDFVEGSWLSEQTWDQVLPDQYEGALGSGGTKWIIGHGCNTATVATYEFGDPADDIVSTPLGVSAWSRSWDQLHLVLGHYYSTTTNLEPDLSQLAYDLRGGDGVRDAYFDAHVDGRVDDRAFGMPSAIAVAPNGCCSWSSDGLWCPAAGCTIDNYLLDETWTQPFDSPMTPVADHNYFVTSWKEYLTGVFPRLAIELHLEASRHLMRSDNIAVRPESYGLEARKVPRLVFHQRDTDWARSTLWQGGERMFGDRVGDAEETGDDQRVALQLEDAVAWVDIRSGAFSFKRLDGARGPTAVEDSREAVDLALDQLASLGLIELAEGETLDVVGVTATRYAGWAQREDDLVPVFFDDVHGEEAPTQYTSEYTVYFGRRFDGIPIVGPPLMVRLDADGKLVAVTRTWREIRGVDGTPIRVHAPRELPEHTTQACGYLEGPAIAYLQTSPGLGCVYALEDEKNGDPLSASSTTTVSFTEDPTLDPLGDPLW